jgi:hypothetical protein
MQNDPAITFDDLRQDYALILHKQERCIVWSTYVRFRRIDLSRRYTRGRSVAKQLPQRKVLDPLNQIMSRECKEMVQDALRRATPAQRNVANLVMHGFPLCEIAKRLGVREARLLIFSIVCDRCFYA